MSRAQLQRGTRGLEGGGNKSKGNGADHGGTELGWGCWGIYGTYIEGNHSSSL